MNVITIEPQNDPRWNKLIATYESSVFHSPDWLRVLAETYNFAPQALVLLSDTGSPKAGLPFCRIVDDRGNRVVSLPFSDYCDPLVNNIDQWNHLMGHILPERCPVILRCLHNEIPAQDHRFELYSRAKWHGLSLQPDQDRLWSDLHSSARRAIRKAQQTGVTVRMAQDKKDLRAFFEMHLRVRKLKYRLLAQPYRFFENIWQQFIEPQRGWLMLALHQNKVLGGTLFLRWQAGLFYKFNASCPNSLGYRPNDLLIWEGIKLGKFQGCRYLDFGLSDWSQTGLVKYKRKFATAEKTINFLKYGDHQLGAESVHQMRLLLPQLTELFTDEAVADPVTEKAGQLLYRFFA